MTFNEIELVAIVLKLSRSLRPVYRHQIALSHCSKFVGLVRVLRILEIECVLVLRRLWLMLVRRILWCTTEIKFERLVLRHPRRTGTIERRLWLLGWFYIEWIMTLLLGYWLVFIELHTILWQFVGLFIALAEIIFKFET